ncbi:PfkB family carbohydrate kinase [Streptomyces sp. P9(2023)]|uniref:PfkB family carbohydrate kinase n=1 Tax=Streptomyces sp. P9(2023) TaxID=3064394 RepID=UPI0028F44E71|nr:PfkB family carbohydrate kinase [Streptomyces sp. P9(2023)]MDT9690064.1 PfkB family carbohydrate kinase [Streptomyces sp. P9(2023)]
MGEALVDLVPAEDGGLRPRPGGAAANVATELARLGARTAFAGALGTDSFGRLIERRLRSAGVELDLCERLALPTALAVADPGGQESGYHFHHQDTATFQLRSRVAEVGGVRAVYVGGLAAVVPPAAEAVLATAVAAGRDAVLAVDPNVRVDRTLDPAGSLHRLRELCALADIVKVSDEDACLLWPSADIPEKSCRKLAAEGRLVLLTRGARGSTVFLADGAEVSVPAKPVTVTNTIGAGDAFMAAVLARLDDTGALDGEGPGTLSIASAQELLRYASSVAAEVCRRTEARPDH